SPARRTGFPRRRVLSRRSRPLPGRGEPQGAGRQGGRPAEFGPLGGGDGGPSRRAARHDAARLNRAGTPARHIMTQSDPQARYRANLQGEVESSSLYRALAEAEANPQIANVYRRLASVEEAHAEFWRKRLTGIGRRLFRPRPGFRSRALAWLTRRFGPAFILPVVNTLERADSGQYDTQPEAVFAGLPQAERSHARILQAVAGP